MTDVMEMKKNLQGYVEMLIRLGFEIDPEQVDYEQSVRLMVAHEFLDFSEAETPDEVHMAELRNLARAVYFDGQPVFDCQAESAERQMKLMCECLKELRIGVIGEGDPKFFGFSPKRVIHSEMQVLTPKQLVVGMNYMLYWQGKASMIQMVSQDHGSFCFRTFEGIDGDTVKWSSVSCKPLTSVGIRPLEMGPKLTKVWNIKNYLETL